MTLSALLDHVFIYFVSDDQSNVSLTLTLGWKNEKRPSGPIELDLEAGNLVDKL